MVNVQLESTASLPLVLLTFVLGIHGVAASNDSETCSLTADVLDCSNRGFETVPQIENINATFPLKLNLSSNYIAIDSGDVFNFIYLWSSDSVYVSELYLDHNRIQYLPPETLNPLLRTKILDLSWNQMENIPDKLFSGLMEMRRLSLAGNPIGELDIALPPTIEDLDVSSCSLSRIGPQMFERVHLKRLDVSNNSLTAMDWSLLDSETSVRVDGNPWDCDLLWQDRPDLASLQERCTTTTGSETTTTETTTVTAEVEGEASTTTESPQSGGPAPPEELLWSSFGIVEGVLVGWLVYLLVVGSVAWLRARSLQRDLARDGNWWLEPRL